MANPKTITQRITLEGGTEIEAQLKRLGATGEAMFKNIQGAAAQVKGPPSAFVTRLKEIQVALKQSGDSITRFGRGARDLGRNLSIMGAAIGGAVTGLLLLARSGANAAESMGENAQKAGTTIEEFSRLKFAAEQADVGAEQLVGGLSRLNKQLGAAADGNRDAAQLFEDLGVKIFSTGTKLRPTEQIMQDLSEAFSRLPDGAEKSAAALAIFGRGGAELLPFLNTGREAMQEFGREAERLGLVFTKEQFAVADAFNDTVGQMFAAFRGVRDQVAQVFLPALTNAAAGIRDFVADNRDTIVALAERIRDAFSAIPGPIRAAIGGLVGIAIVIGPALIAFGLFVQVIGFAVTGLAGLAGGIVSVLGAIGSLPVMLARVVASLGSVFLALGFWPIAIGVAVAAIAAAVILIVRHWDEIKQAFQQGVDKMRDLLAGVGDFFRNVFISAAAAVKGALNSLTSFFTGWVNRIIAGFKRVIDWVKKAVAAVAGAKADGVTTGGGGGFAEGGLVRGRGTSTSDSILARLSDKEFVIKAAAVRKYGAGIFAALNAMRLPAGAVPRFATGGLVNAVDMSGLFPVPRFATGGQVSISGGNGQVSGRTLNLTIGSETFAGLLMPETVAAKMERFAVKQQMRSAGRKPSWFGA